MNKIPYFETIIKRVKKEEEEWTPDCCPCCGAKREAEKPLGNWVNGENLDKIKFPCFCSYNAGYTGMITKDGMNYYELHNIEKQADENYLGGRTLVAKELDLKILVKCWHIHILKGKLTLFEEE